jgi:SAM-dependent methyltransferase
MWDPGWDKLFTNTAWGSYPSEEVIRFVARRFYNASDRKLVRILEIGSGPGANLWYLAREGFAVDGLDGSRIAIEQAAARLARENLSASLHVGDAMHMPFADAVFDCVLDVECVYANTFADSRRIISEVIRVLKPGGWLFSKTFATGLTGEVGGEFLVGEPNTWLRLGPGSALHSEYGIIRLTDESEISALYAGFSHLEWDRVERTDQNRAKLVREWLISACK